MLHQNIPPRKRVSASGQAGFSLSFMEEQVLGEKSPLFGRRTARIKLDAFDYPDLMDASLSLDDNIKKQF